MYEVCLVEFASSDLETGWPSSGAEFIGSNLGQARKYELGELSSQKYQLTPMALHVILSRMKSRKYIQHQQILFGFIARLGCACRREIEAFGLASDIQPHETTSALREGRNAGLWICVERRSKGNIYEAYYIAGTKPNFNSVSRAINTVQLAATAVEKGLAGEYNFRSLLKDQECELFHGITPKAKVGRAVASSDKEHFIDLKATYIDGVSEFAVEVKNWHSTIYSAEQSFAPLLKIALERGMFPLFVASFIDSRAIQVCDAIGIATVTIGKQLWPKHVRRSDRWAIERLDGKSRIEFLDMDRSSRRLATLDRAMLINRLNDKLYFDAHMETWNKNAPRLLRCFTTGVLGYNSALYEIRDCTK